MRDRSPQEQRGPAVLQWAVSQLSEPGQLLSLLAVVLMSVS